MIQKSELHIKGLATGKAKHKITPEESSPGVKSCLFYFRRFGQRFQRALVPPPDLAHRQPDRVGDIPERFELDMTERQNLDVDFIQRKPCDECAAAVDGADLCY